MKGFILHDIIDQLRNSNSFPRRLEEALRYLKRNKELIITKADKGGKTVVMDKRVYIQKMNSLLDDENTYKKLTKNPLKNWQTTYNRKLKSILKDYPDQEKRFRAYLPTLPCVYGLSKIHKEGNPLRPIVSTINSVNYKLAAFLSKHLSPLLNTIANTHIINNNHFINRIKSYNLFNRKMVSFDVKSLFTKVPVLECLQFIKEKLPTANLDIPVSCDVFIRLIELCVSDCFFTFNDEFCNQIYGLPMGSPISPV